MLDPHPWHLNSPSLGFLVCKIRWLELNNSKLSVSLWEGGGVGSERTRAGKGYRPAQGLDLREFEGKSPAPPRPAWEAGQLQPTSSSGAKILPSPSPPEVLFQGSGRREAL